MVALGVDISVQILVDGVALPEYQVESSEGGKTVSCWIPSEAGKTFAIRYDNNNRSVDTGFDAYMDGCKCSGKNLHARSHSKKRRGGSSTLIGMTRGEEMYPFMFSVYELTDDDNFYPNVTSINSLGEIRVDVSEVAIGEKPKRKRGTPLGRPHLNPLKIHEKSKKGIIHGVQLGEPVPGSRRGNITTDICLLGSVTFRYRPMDILRADGRVLPRVSEVQRGLPPEVLDLTLEDDEHGSEDERIKSLKEELRKLEDKKQGKKRKREDNIVKREVKKEPKLEETMIDLT